MTVLSRQTQKVFAGNANASQIAVMGSMKTGTPVYSSSLAILQSAAYELGWDSALLSDKAPYLEEMNGVQYGFSYQLAYLLQEGIPEYDQGTNYSKTSIVKIVENNNLVLYHSLIDDNIGVADITTSTNWARLYIVDYGRIGEPQITLNNTLPPNCIWLDGTAVSRSTYSDLFDIYGTTYGAGDGSTTFNLPDFRGRAIWGAGAFGYIAAGLPNITATTKSAGSHKHSQRSTREDDGGAYITSGAASSSYSSDVNTASAGAHTHQVVVSASVSGILGNSTTVQPPAIKVRVYTRWQ